MRVAYVSYDGVLDPLGATQVVPYLEALSGLGVRFELISFEKASRSADFGRKERMQARLAAAGIGWRPLRYHKSPRIPATLYDVFRGAVVLRRLAGAGSFELFHARGEIASLIVGASQLRGPLLHDMRGFFADERVDAASWSRGSWIDRAVRGVERLNMRRASRVVVLTEGARNVLRARDLALPIDVIPTAVDCRVFDPARFREDVQFDLVYFGSLGGWYMTSEMLDFAAQVRRLDGNRARVLFLANNVEPGDRERIEAAGVSLHEAAPEKVPQWLARCRAAYFFIRPTASKVASCPTKLAEALAMGLPVLTGPGIGDVDQMLEVERVGIVLREFSLDAYRAASLELQTLVADPETPRRCRAAAERRLSLTAARDTYAAAYSALAKSPLSFDQRSPPEALRP